MTLAHIIVYSGEAIAFDKSGDCVRLVLSDIYDLAEAKFGTRPGLCEY